MPHGVPTMSASMRHGALLVAVTGTLLIGAFFARPTHADARADAAATTRPQDSRLMQTGSIDGRLPDGVPGMLAAATAVATPIGEARTLVAVTALDPPSVTATAAARATTPTATPDPTPALAALAATAQEPRATSVPVLTRITATPAPEPTVQAAVAAPAPSRYASINELNIALAQTAWPAEHWPTIVAIALCESGVDRDRDGRYDAVDTQASGAGGRYIGTLQIGATHRFSQPHDLWSLVGNLNAGYELWVGAGQSFAPWGCH